MDIALESTNTNAEVITLDKNLFGNGIPMGFGMALAQNTTALNYFSNLSEEERLKIIEGAKNVQSKQEMRSYVGNLSKGQDSIIPL